MEEIVVKAEKLVAGGSCLARVDGKAVFVPLAVPGEVLSVRLTRRTRDWDEAEVVRVLEPSPHRAEPFCPLYGRCGGCNLQHVAPEFQRTLRLGLLRDAFAREGVEIPGETAVVSGADRGYRARIRLTDGGFLARGSSETVFVPECPVATPEVNAWLKGRTAEERGAGRVHVFGDRRAAVPGNVVAARAGERRRAVEVVGGNAERRSRVKARRNARFSGTSGGAEREAARCEVEILGRRIAFDARGFFQSNMEVLEKAVSLVSRGLSGGRALDMYAGCGTFSAFTAPSFSRTTLVEHNRDALVCAEENLRGVPHESAGLSGGAWAKRLAPPPSAFDAAVVDPPRSGIEREVTDWLCGAGEGAEFRGGIPRIRSVSCDAATHARDAARLVRAGYRLRSLSLLDFYPQTAHTESMAEFEFIGGK